MLEVACSSLQGLLLDPTQLFIMLLGCVHGVCECVVALRSVGGVDASRIQECLLPVERSLEIQQQTYFEPLVCARLNTKFSGWHRMIRARAPSLKSLASRKKG